MTQEMSDEETAWEEHMKTCGPCYQHYLIPMPGWRGCKNGYALRDAATEGFRRRMQERERASSTGR